MKLKNKNKQHILNISHTVKKFRRLKILLCSVVYNLLLNILTKLSGEYYQGGQFPQIIVKHWYKQQCKVWILNFLSSRYLLASPRHCSIPLLFLSVPVLFHGPFLLFLVLFPVFSFLLFPVQSIWKKMMGYLICCDLSLFHTNLCTNCLFYLSSKYINLGSSY